MNKIFKIATSTLVAFTLAASVFSAPAFAGKKERRIAIGAIAGLVGGAIIANEINRNRSQPIYQGRVRAQPRYVEPEYAPVYERAPVREYYEAPRRTRYERPRMSRWERHVRRCERAYRTYDRNSDTYLDNRGRERICDL